jgi:hypothetical protein
LSGWGDLDFEALRYDNAHLGIGRINQRSWSMLFLGGARLTMNGVHNNPYWGGGLLCLLQIPKLSLIEKDETIGSNELNVWANLVSDVPTFGAWCSDNDDFVFVQFLPNFVKELPRLLDLMVEQAGQRWVEAKLLVQAERDRRKDEAK